MNYPQHKVENIEAAKFAILKSLPLANKTARVAKSGFLDR